MSDKKNRSWTKALKKAESLEDSPEKVGELLVDAQAKAEKKRSALGAAYDDVQTLSRMVSAWRSKEYTVIPWKTAAAAIGAILYFVMPLDAIPDFIFALGFLDDITIITLTIKQLKNDIDKFREWETSTPEKALEHDSNASADQDDV